MSLDRRAWLVHELGHLLGIRHCVHFCCVMNPTAGLPDLDRLARAVALRDLYAELGMIDERDWTNARIREGTP